MNNFKIIKFAVSDHNNWYYYAKEEGITHWWNGE